MITLENPAGRLIHIRVASPLDVPDVAAMQQQLQAVLAGKDGRFVVAVDVRAAGVFPPEISDAFLAVVREDDPRFERSGYFISESATFALQIERLFRQLDSPIRKAFRSADDLFEWLSPLLDGDEQARLRGFLAELAC